MLLWGHCPRCDRWFHIPNPQIDAYRLCPVDLTMADCTERRDVEQAS